MRITECCALFHRQSVRGIVHEYLLHCSRVIGYSTGLYGFGKGTVKGFQFRK